MAGGEKHAERVRRVGLISDTHGLVRREALDALQGVDLILHAGDVGKPEVLASLRSIAPVAAVRGNVDRGDWANHLPEQRRVEAERHVIVLVHELSRLDVGPHAGLVSIVVSGHSHRPSIEQRGDTLYVNPGSAGPRRFRLPVCVARLVLDGRRARATLIELSV